MVSPRLVGWSLLRAVGPSAPARRLSWLPGPQPSLYYGSRVRGLGFPKAFPIAVLDELGQGDFPGFLVMIGQAAEFLGVHPQFPRHLDLRVRQPILRARRKPRL